jgi:diadenosine tetraphosphatase ApaH/serine/threonine PP2A family protein phosphatase
MKIALLSDLHANRHALEACLTDAQLRGAQQYAFLGDLVGYGAEPAAVLDIIMALAREGAWVLRGNHDDAALGANVGTHRADGAGAEWTRNQLKAVHCEFMAKLPLVLKHDFILLVHASAHEPQRWEYVKDNITASMSMNAAAASGASHVFCGHVHEQRLFFQGAAQRVMAFEPTPDIAVPAPRHRRWLATVGSVGQPRDGRSEAMYAIFDTASLHVTFVRVPYDFEAAARAILAAGLPEFYAKRLAQGR